MPAGVDWQTQGKIARKYASNMTQTKIAKDLLLNRKTVGKYLRLFHEGALGGLGTRKGCWNKIRKNSQEVKEVYAQLVSQYPASYMMEYADRLTVIFGVKFTVRNVQDLNKELNIRRTKMGGYSHHVDPEHAHEWEQTILHAPGLEVHHFVFMDQAHFFWNNLNRTFGWSRKDQRISVQQVCRGEVRHVSAAVFASIHGILHISLTESTFKGQDMESMVESLIEDGIISAFPGTGCLLVLDNASINGTAPLKEALWGAGAAPLYTSPYCPWQQPMELAHNTVKALLRKHGAQLLAEGYSLMDILFPAYEWACTPEKMKGYIAHVPGNIYKA
ncbi:unnamed protein product [Pedinophyceae sp. YPF-701]|nr:unnamed protein product [Pedinophyceae sp. YPF-701]